MSTTPSPIRILLADDHPVLRQGIQALAADECDLHFVAEASNGLEAIEQFRKHRPDIALMDLEMPGVNGIDAMIAIRNEFPDARIIILTTYAGDVRISRALKAGARGYLLKSLLRKELLDTIRAVHAGQKRIPADLATQVADHVADDTLTLREIEVLRLIAAGNANKLMCRSIVDHRGDRQGWRQKHSLQTGCERPNSRGHDRTKTRSHAVALLNRSGRTIVPSLPSIQIWGR